MNYIPQICEMLGLEWDEEKQESEEFKVKNAYRQLEPYKFTIEGLVDKDGWSCGLPNSILNGKLEIIKKVLGT